MPASSPAPSSALRSEALQRASYISLLALLGQSKMWAGKPWLELPRLCNVVLYKVIIYTNYRIHLPYVRTDACFTSTPFVGQEKESCPVFLWGNPESTKKKKGGGNQLLLHSFRWKRGWQSSQAHFRLKEEQRELYCKQLCVQPWFPGKMGMLVLFLSAASLNVPYTLAKPGQSGSILIPAYFKRKKKLTGHRLWL